MIMTGEEYEESQHQPHDDIEGKANVEKDIEQNRPGMTKFRNFAAKKRKAGSLEVSRISSVLEIIYVYYSFFIPCLFMTTG